MISNKIRDARRGRALKMPKNIERLYKEGKCNECSVVVTRMDFAKILGKFTKVKIQYESSSTPRTRRNIQLKSPTSNAKLKSNENGMVLIHRNASNKLPMKDVSDSKKSKSNATPAVRSTLKENSQVSGTTPRKANNILKENNRLKKTLQNKNSSYTKNVVDASLKQYGIIFISPIEKNNNNNVDLKTGFSLTELLPCIDKSILPSEGWCIDYLPNGEEPKDDKVYDRIAAELEDLMNNEGPSKLESKTESAAKVDDFPSIMDILNDSATENKESNQSNPIEEKSNLESSDVEAMLLGKSSETKIETESTPMELSDVGNLIEDVVQLNPVQESDNKLQEALAADPMDNPNSPSILDETLQKGAEEYLPSAPFLSEEINNSDIKKAPTDTVNTEQSTNQIEDTEPKNANKETKTAEKNFSGVTHVVFKKCLDGRCLKSVTCPKNMKYNIELEGKPVEFLGAPKFISSIEDLQVLLQIVNESEPDSLYVL